MIIVIKEWNRGNFENFETKFGFSLNIPNGLNAISPRIIPTQTFNLVQNEL